MKIRRTQRKAVAPVLATLMMIAVAVAMSVIIFVWSQGFLSQTSSAAGGQQSQQNIAAQSSISVELAVFTTGSSHAGGATCGGASDGTPKMTIVVRNVGSITETLGSLLISGNPSNAGFKGSITILSVSSTATSSPASVTSATDAGIWTYSTSAAAPAKSASATISVCDTITGSIPTTTISSGDIIIVKVSTTAGTFATQQFTVP